MSKIENTKQYTGQELSTIFFRPMLTGPDAEKIGVKVLYNMPAPTTLHYWRRSGDILQKYSESGWKGGTAAERFQKKIEMSRVKAEMSYSAQDYFNLVYEQLANSANVNLDDLSGTELEQAETALFREAMAESIRVTMWLGATARKTGGYDTFDGFLKRIYEDFQNSESALTMIAYSEVPTADEVEAFLKNMWDNASVHLKDLRQEGNLAYFVTSDIYEAYENYLNDANLESAFIAKQEGHERLSYRGIPLVDVQLSAYLPNLTNMPSSFAILTDRRNLALAVNVASYPGTEIRMWYNPDEMENRQRAIFMAGCDYLMPELLVFASLE